MLNHRSTVLTTLLGLLCVTSTLPATPPTGGSAAADTATDTATALVQAPPGFGFSDWVRRRMQRRASWRRDAAVVTQLLKPLAETAGAATVDVWEDGVLVALATIVSPDGLAITKASELGDGDIRVRLSSGEQYRAAQIGTQRSADLALLQIEGAPKMAAVSLQPYHATPGSYLISIGPGGDVMGLGTVGADLIDISDQGKMGIGLARMGGQIVVTQVIDGSGADEAGVEAGDQILQLEGSTLEGPDDLIERVDELFPGEFVQLKIRRNEKELELNVEIRETSFLFEDENEAKVNGPRSSRAGGFESAIWHDTVLGPDQCGGPVMDSSGKVVGINIARAGRVVSYALPTRVIMPLLQEMQQAAGQEAGLIGTGK